MRFEDQSTKCPSCKGPLTLLSHVKRWEEPREVHEVHEDLMLPLLKFTEDEKEHTLREAIEHLSQQFGLSEADRMKLLPSGQRAIIDNRIGWARTYLKKAGLLSYPRRGYFKITRTGFDVLKQNPPRIDVRYLEQFPEFVAFKTTMHLSGIGLSDAKCYEL